MEGKRSLNNSNKIVIILEDENIIWLKAKKSEEKIIFVILDQKEVNYFKIKHS